MTANPYNFPTSTDLNAYIHTLDTSSYTFNPSLTCDETGRLTNTSALLIFKGSSKERTAQSLNQLFKAISSKLVTLDSQSLKIISEIFVRSQLQQLSSSPEANAFLTRFVADTSGDLKSVFPDKQAFTVFVQYLETSPETHLIPLTRIADLCYYAGQFEYQEALRITLRAHPEIGQANEQIIDSMIQDIASDQVVDKSEMINKNFVSSEKIYLTLYPEKEAKDFERMIVEQVQRRHPPFSIVDNLVRASTKAPALCRVFAKICLNAAAAVQAEKQIAQRKVFVAINTIQNSLVKTYGIDIDTARIMFLYGDEGELHKQYGDLFLEICQTQNFADTDSVKEEILPALSSLLTIEDDFLKKVIASELTIKMGSLFPLSSLHIMYGNSRNELFAQCLNHFVQGKTREEIDKNLPEFLKPWIETKYKPINYINFYDFSKIGSLLSGKSFRYLIQHMYLTSIDLRYIPPPEDLEQESILSTPEKRTDEDLAALAKRTPHLYQLKLDGQNLITDAGILTLLKSCPNFTKLSIASTGIKNKDNKVLNALLKMEKLEVLELDENQFDPAQLKTFTETMKRRNPKFEVRVAGQEMDDIIRPTGEDLP